MAMDEYAGQGSKTQLAASLEAGLENISYFQEIEFFQYVRVVLPADNFVFWVRRATLSKTALQNMMALNNVPANQVATVVAYAPKFTIKGSLHIASSLEQTESQTYVTNRVILTTQEQVKNLEDIHPLVMYIAAPKNNETRYSFSSHDNFYQAAGTWHYGGNGVYADLQSQLIEDPSKFSTNNLIVSNSLPIWLSMNAYSKKLWDIVGGPEFPLYPSFTVPENIQPPFASVHIEPQNTNSLSSTSTLTRDGSSYQLCSDIVKVTMYGANNAAAQDFQDFVCQFTLDNPTLIGLMSNPVIRDEKRGQVELNALAQKKTVEFTVNYYQSRVRNVARQLITQVQETFLIQ